MGKFAPFPKKILHFLSKITIHSLKLIKRMKYIEREEFLLGITYCSTTFGRLLLEKKLQTIRNFWQPCPLSNLSVSFSFFLFTF